MKAARFTEDRKHRNGIRKHGTKASITWHDKQRCNREHSRRIELEQSCCSADANDALKMLIFGFSLPRASLASFRFVATGHRPILTAMIDRIKRSGSSEYGLDKDTEKESSRSRF